MRSATSEDRKKDLESAAKRLIDGTGMGGQYKVLGITPKRVKGMKEDCFPFDLEGIEQK